MKCQSLEETTIAEVLRAASEQLARQGSPTPRLDAEVLLRHVLGLDRTALFLRLNAPLEPEDLARFEALLARRLAGVPVAYLIGEREFMGLPFHVGSGVLVPRPETEHLVEWALEWLRARPGSKIVDVGTGSGAIALSIAHHVPPVPGQLIVGADISRDALRIAASNREHLGLNERVHLVRGDLLTWCRGPLDLVLANLPYLRPSQIAENPEIHAEPRLALEGGPDGFDLYRRLLADVERVLALDGALAYEIDPSQADLALAATSAAFPGARVSIRPDLAGLPRLVVAEHGAGRGMMPG